MKRARAPEIFRAVDLFCGGGFATEAMMEVLREFGVTNYEVLAINHWKKAIETHRHNHPTVVHVCQSIENVNPKQKVFVDEVTGRVFRNTGRFGLLLAGPECIYHSRARGGKPINDQRRSSAWRVLDWISANYIDNVLIENVPEFQEWATLGANGRPLKSHRGDVFNAYIETIRSHGYHLERRVLCAADNGDPTTRERLFIMARKKALRVAVNWPEPTHSKTAGRSLLRETEKWRAAREVIDWTIPSRSIFDPTRKPIAPKTFQRILAGLERFGGKDLEPFILVLRNHADARSVDEPLPTLCGGGQHFGLVQASATIAKALTEDGYADPQPFLIPVTHGGGENRAMDINRPMPTITGAHRGEIAVCEPMVLAQGQGGAARPVSQPVPTIVGGGAHQLMEPFLITAGGPIGQGRTPNSVNDPLPTVLAENHRALCEPFLVPHYGERDGQAPRVHSVDEPVPTIPATGGGKFEVAEPFLMTVAHGTKPGDTETRRVHALDEPLGTVVGSNRLGLVQPFIVPPRGFDQTGRKVDSVDQPLRTITAVAGHTFAVVEPELKDESFIASYYGTQNISPVSAPLPTVTAKDRFALVMPVVNGRALDIRLRMLQPRELARAMSIGDHYWFAGNKGDAVKQIGNGWPKRTGKALIRMLLIERFGAKSEKSEAIA